MDCAFFQAMIVPPDETKPLLRLEVANGEFSETWWIPF